MEHLATSSKLLRFGLYEVDLRTSELWKRGHKIKLQEQPCRILAILLEQAGEVVTREDLRKKLWSEDTLVDFDHGLNTAIMRLREALGESSENPLFIETLPRLGYRFIAQVEQVGGEDQEKQSAEEPVAPTQPDHGSPPSGLRRPISNEQVALTAKGKQIDLRRALVDGALDEWLLGVRRDDASSQRLVLLIQHEYCFPEGVVAVRNAPHPPAGEIGLRRPTPTAASSASATIM